MKWFGEPWPSPELRASVCEDDANRIETPVGRECCLCSEEIEAQDQGVTLGHLEIDERDPHLTWVKQNVAHLRCLLEGIGGGEAQAPAET